MNQLYRALHIPPKRLLRKLSGEKEIYTIAVRPVPKAEGTDPLPALGGTPNTMLPARPGGPEDVDLQIFRVDFQLHLFRFRQYRR